MARDILGSLTPRSTPARRLAEGCSTAVLCVVTQCSSPQRLAVKQARRLAMCSHLCAVCVEFTRKKHVRARARRSLSHLISYPFGHIWRMTQPRQPASIPRAGICYWYVMIVIWFTANVPSFLTVLSSKWESIFRPVDCDRYYSLSVQNGVRKRSQVNVHLSGNFGLLRFTALSLTCTFYYF